MSDNLREIINLSKIERMCRTGDATVFVQFTSGNSHIYEYTNFEDADNFEYVFVDWCLKNRTSSAFIIWRSELIGGAA